MRSRTSSRSPWSRRSASSVCRRNAASAPNLPSGDVVTIEGRFISLAGDPSAPGIVGFSGDWPNVLADVQLYGTDSSGEKLSEDIEVSVSQGGESYPAALLPDPTITAGQAVTTPGLSPAQRAKLQTAASEAAGTVAAQLKPYFAGQGWIARGKLTIRAAGLRRGERIGCISGASALQCVAAVIRRGQ